MRKHRLAAAAAAAAALCASISPISQASSLHFALPAFPCWSHSPPSHCGFAVGAERRRVYVLSAPYLWARVEGIVLHKILDLVSRSVAVVERRVMEETFIWDGS